MGIGYFPTIYEDELIYSVLARFYAHSGYLAYVWCAKDIYAYNIIKPDVEFINKLKPEIKELIEKQISWEDVIIKHTMYLYYSRVVDLEKRNQAKQILMDFDNGNDEKISNLLSVPMKKGLDTIHLKYCPYCVAEDRKKYGETYWHRRHQIRGLNFCYKHGCRLSESNIEICQSRGKFVCAENEIGNEAINANCSDFFKLYAGYVINVLEQSNYKPCILGTYMELRAKETYSKARKKRVSLSELNRDFHKWKRETGIKGMFYGERYLYDIFSGKKRNPYSICELAFFLNIKEKEMAYPEYNAYAEIDSVDIKVIAMATNGKSICSIAKELGMSEPTIKTICMENGIKSIYSIENIEQKHLQDKEKRILEEKNFWLQVKEKYPDKTYKELCKIGSYRKHLVYLRNADREWTDNNWFEIKKGNTRNWKKLDEETLPLLQNEIEKMLDEDTSVKITYSLMERKLNLYKGIWKKLPQCKAVIDRYRIS